VYLPVASADEYLLLLLHIPVISNDLLFNRPQEHVALQFIRGLTQHYPM